MVQDRQQDQAANGLEAQEELSFGEEELDSGTSGRDLLASGVIGLFALAALVLALRLPNPGTAFTAPALFPIVIALTLMCMAAGLGFSAWLRGGWAELLQKRHIRTAAENLERKRTGVLIAIIAAYVVLLEFITFDLSYPTRLLELRFSGYEAVSIPILTLVLRIFWRAHVLRCLLVSVLIVMALAWIFRYGFKILLPGSG